MTEGTRKGNRWQQDREQTAGIVQQIAGSDIMFRGILSEKLM